MEEQEAHDRFLLLVEEYRMAAWIGLGKLKDPGSGEARQNLDLARHVIDTLGMLEQKTRGNLGVEEEKFLRQALTDLRLNYVEERKSAERDQVAAAAQGSTGAPATPESPDGPPGWHRERLSGSPRPSARFEETRAPRGGY